MSASDSLSPDQFKTLYRGTAAKNVDSIRDTGLTPDFKANGMMSGQLKKGNAKRGYYYRNISEDSGSVSAVVPSWNHLKDMRS